MITHIYRSEKKSGAYLYLAHDKTLDDVPANLLAMLAPCIHVMELDLSQRKHLASENIETVKSNLTAEGFHLQVPPKVTTGVVHYGQ